MKLSKKDIRELMHLALHEDIRSGDITTNAIISKNVKGNALIKSKSQGVVAGLDVVSAVYAIIDKNVRIKALVSDGEKVKKNEVLMKISGPAASILKGERVALNFLQRLCGIASMTRNYADKLKGLPARVLDTRKTTPGMRVLEKYAVKIGGGENHRMGLYDMFLIKDNHIEQAGSISKAVEKVRAWKKKNKPHGKIEVETRTLREVREAIICKVDRIMLDNMGLDIMKKAVILIRNQNPHTEIEASGNVTLKNIRSIAHTGVDYVSAGAITHSVAAFDLSLIIKNR